ncbi:MAG: YncE family protein [Terriglobales bacterium]
MATQTQLQTGLGGAIGCDFRTAQNQLIFVEYDTGKLSALTVAPATPGYKVLGTGYNQPEDVKLSVDGVHAYVTERSGDLVRVSLSSANRSAATVIATGMTAPQQLFLDEAHNAAYVVEFASPGRLFKIDLTSGVKTVVTAALDQPIGVVLSSDLQYAYVSEQTTGPDKGRISKVQISSAARTTLVKGLTNPFFLTWADEAEDSLFVPQRDPANSILTVNVTSGASTVVVSGVPVRPSSVAVPYSGQILICSDSVIEEVSFSVFLSDGPLLMGIGLIPANFIDQTTGKATTPANSPYQVTDAPFGGTLPIMVNYQSADGAHAAYYQVQVDGVTQTDSWTTYHWDGTTNVLITVPSKTIGGSIGCFPVHPVADLFDYQPPALGYELDSTSLSNGMHTIVLQFLDSTGKKMTPDVKSLPLKILVNNQSCVATLSPPVLNSTPPQVADPNCGVLHYGTNKALTVTLAFTASQPANFANFSFALYRGVGAVGPPPTLPSGPVATAPSSVTAKVSDMLGPCPTAGFAAEVYVAATMTNGWGRQSQYDAEALMGFVLTP